METFSGSLALREGNPPVYSPHKTSVMCWINYFLSLLPTSWIIDRVTSFFKTPWRLLQTTSLMWDIDYQCVRIINFICAPSCRILTKEVEALKEKSASFSRIVLLAGGNDAAADPDESDLESAIDNYKSLVNAAKEISQNIAITEIPPRFQPPHAQENINALNANLESVAQELGAEFLRNDNIFFLRDHEVNDGYMLDTVHLNMKGSNKLAKSMGLISKNKNDYHVCSRKPRQSSPLTRNSPKPAAVPNSRYNADQRESSGAAHQSSSGAATRPANNTARWPSANRGETERYDTDGPDTDTAYRAAFFDTARAKTRRHVGSNYNRQSHTYAQIAGWTNLSNPNKQRYCEKCGESNHEIHECRHKRKIECHECSRLGHKSKFCHFYWKTGQN